MGLPDLTEPIVGYRGWRVAHDGRLTPWSARPAGAWSTGVNTAVCLIKPDVRGHVAPMRRCTCGLYALASVWDARLDPHTLAVGAIVAWGDIEVHFTGFRAQSAVIVALGMPEGCDPVHRRRLTLAAERYGAALVPLAGLPAAAGEYGRRLELHDVDPPTPARNDQEIPRLSDAGRAGIAIHAHLSVEIVADRVRLAPTDLIAADFLRGPEVLHHVGAQVRRGDPLLGALGRGGALTVPSPVSGVVTRVADDDPRSACAARHWRVEIAPAAWTDDAVEIAWGSRSRAIYIAEVASASHRGDPFIQLRTHWLNAHADVRSAGDVVAALRAARGTPRFASEAAVYEQIGERLRAAFRDPATAQRLTRMPIRILWRLHQPDAELLLDFTGACPAVFTGTPDRDADIVLFAAAATADEVFLGRTDVPAALRRREIQSAAPLSVVLHAESVLKAVKPAYAALAGRARQGRAASH